MRELVRRTLSASVASAIVRAIRCRAITAPAPRELAAYESWQWCDPVDEQRPQSFEAYAAKDFEV